MAADPEVLHRFLAPQVRDFGAQLEIDPGFWALFSIPIADPDARALATALLASAPFPYDYGQSDDDWWTIYYVTTEHQLAAIDWITDLAKVAAGEIRPVSAQQATLIAEVLHSSSPHRAARELGELHASGAIAAGLIRTPIQVRGLLDRLHVREPLYFAALQTLLTHHLVDMLVLHRQLIPEDVDLKNEIVKAGLSRDPFQQSRQDATAEIRNILLRFRVISPLDQQKSAASINPYAAFFDIAREGDQVVASIDGVSQLLPRTDFLGAIHSIRRRLYYGEPIGSLNTEARWMHSAIAHSFRFIKQRVEGRRDLVPLDALYMLERSIDA